MRKTWISSFLLGCVFPVLFCFLFEIFFKTYYPERVLNVIENLFFGAIFFLILRLFSIFKNTVVLKLSFALLWAVFAIETVFYYWFSATFSASSIYILLESNVKEARDFLGFYLSPTILSFLGVFFCLYLVFITKAFTSTAVFFRQKSRVVWYKRLFVLLGLVLFLKTTNLIIYNTPYMVVRSVVIYIKSRSQLKNLQSHSAAFKNTTIDTTRYKNSTHVVVIGESTTKNHMQLYGYAKKTTPLLKAASSVFSVYSNVISPHTHTIASLSKALTLGNYEQPSHIYKGSILQLLNKAGYTTFWISNQQPVGLHESGITKIASAARYRYFNTMTNSGNRTPLDQELFPEFKKALAHKAKNKVIFVHLQGTHIAYHTRYPKAFSFFTTKNTADTQKNDIINHYDNAVLYNDYVVHSLWQFLKTQKQEYRTFLYFSDHGEEVYQTTDFSGHSEDVATKPMFEIPFLLWESSLEKSRASDMLQRPYMIDDLFYSILDLYHIKSPHKKPSRSIFSDAFIPRKRRVLADKDFDTLFKLPVSP